MIRRDLRVEWARGCPATPCGEHQYQLLNAFARQDGHAVAACDAVADHAGGGSIGQALQVSECQRRALINGMNRNLIRMPVGEFRERRTQRAKRDLQNVRING